jgi:hypothetical protein
MNFAANVLPSFRDFIRHARSLNGLPADGFNYCQPGSRSDRHRVATHPDQ